MKCPKTFAAKTVPIVTFIPERTVHVVPTTCFSVPFTSWKNVDGFVKNVQSASPKRKPSLEGGRCQTLRRSAGHIRTTRLRQEHARIQVDNVQVREAREVTIAYNMLAFTRLRQSSPLPPLQFGTSALHAFRIAEIQQQRRDLQSHIGRACTLFQRFLRRLNTRRTSASEHEVHAGQRSMEVTIMVDKSFSQAQSNAAVKCQCSDAWRCVCVCVCVTIKHTRDIAFHKRIIELHKRIIAVN